MGRGGGSTQTTKKEPVIEPLDKGPEPINRQAYNARVEDRRANSNTQLIGGGTDDETAPKKKGLIG